MSRLFLRNLFAIIITIMFCCVGCSRKESATAKPASDGLQVVTTLFPLYDFARLICGDRATVTLLLPPGVEPHHFEPRPDDIVRIGKAGLFVYTSRVMEPWAARIINDDKKRKVPLLVEAGNGVQYQDAVANDVHEDHNAHVAGVDPHVWLDFANDRILVDNILAGFIAVDPVNADYYRGNAGKLKERLGQLDGKYREGLASCASRTLLHGGHYTFGYLARRYGLTYRALSGVSSEAEPSAARMAEMVREIKRKGNRFLFAEELLSPRLSETLAAEAGVAILKLHGAHNLGRDDLQRGVGFFDLMEANLVNLQKGLACQTK